MHNEIQKTTKIIDEIVAMFLKRGSREIDIKVKKDDESTHIFLTILNYSMSAEKINELSEFLNIQRQSEIEEYYWGLMGETSNDDELFLIGSMIDEAIIKQNENDLYVELIRKIK